MNPPRTPAPNACLIAILLITRDSSGDKLTFHYPPKPTVDTPLPPTSTYTASSASSSAASDVASSGDEDDDRRSLTTLHDLTAVERSESGSRIGRRRSRKAVVPEEPAEEEETTKDDGGPPWETVLGFKADFLAGLLAPKAGMCKRKFELTVDDVVFLGFPLHVRPDGLWRKKKKRRGRGTEEEELEERMEEAVVADRGSDAEEEEKEEVGKEEEAEEEGVEAAATATGANGGDAADEEKDGDDEGSSIHGGGMSMFHVVFVLNPPEMEYHFRTKQIFNEVVKRFARALKYEQAKDGYVWREAVKINRLRDKAVQDCMPFSELWRQILEQSSLAYAISRIFTDISQNKIAHIFLNKSLGLSLQIPITTETSVLPSITDPQIPGLPLTTADSFGDDDNEGDNLLVRHFTLLFLVDVDSILKDIAESSDSTNSLAHFVKSCKPSMSFLQISNSSGIPLHNIQLMARHLIHWRKARAIPPIHHRDIYIVSPNADMKRLHTLIPVYAKLFPTLPTLPKILSLLSQKPKQFAAFIPSRDHRSAYCDILAWLLRHGLVTQLRNFAWIRVTRDIKLRVFREQQQQQTALLSRSLSLSRSISRSRSPSPEPSRADIVASAAFAYEPHPEDPAFEESIVLAPHQASAVESAWLEMMTKGQPPDVRALWDRLLKYLNGQHAIEKIAVREGISRRDVRRVLGVFDDYIIYVSIDPPL
ncbi:uncharacterized protein H6S33_007457 [Morchella sextelata]|uniref:uncharacterized protein n=1 Tax=Morchella sextelata TaxID=1174677 RepID=UPI001D0466A4|nr:uncharacterized protein H6S33_007457 [Morchella sextelata]KAH0603798.1 hypothetical protein H6S33_007457 [Morchella sextelata]